MGRIAKTEKLINRAVSNWASVKLVPRGIPTYCDQLLRGQARFARKTGATLSVLNPDNTVKLSQDVKAHTKELYVDRFLDWYEIGSLLSIGPNLETVEIYDLDRENNRLVLVSELRANHYTNEYVELFASPIYLNSDASLGVTSINIRSRYNMVNGDVMLFIKTDSLESQVEIEVEQAQFGGISGDPEFPNIYQLDLQAKTIKNLSADEKIYMRAYPAYTSPLVLLQDKLSVQPIPPHLLDYLSGKLREGRQPKEVFSLRLLDKFGTPLTGSLNTYERVGKNLPVISRNIPLDAMVFWDLIKGKFQLSDRGTIAICEDGKFNAKVDLVPFFPPENIEWRLPVTVETETTIRFRFYPNDWQEFVFDREGMITLNYYETDQPAEQIELAIITNDLQSNILFGDWVVEGNIANSVEYTLISQVSGEGSWQSTGIIAKPYFLSTEYVKCRFDTGDYFDAGRLRL